MAQVVERTLRLNRSSDVGKEFFVKDPCMGQMREAEIGPLATPYRRVLPAGRVPRAGAAKPVKIRSYLDIPWLSSMPNVHLTRSMEAYIRRQISSGSYANLSEAAGAGISLLMERDRACQFYALKAELEEAVRDAENGAFSEFDPRAYEPDAFGS